MGFSISRNGITDIYTLFTNLAQDLVDGGFDLIWTEEEPEKVFIQTKYLKVKIDGELVDPSHYIVSTSSPRDITAICSIQFVEGFYPSKDSKTITADFYYLRAFKQATDIPVLGTPSSFNNIFKTTGLSDTNILDEDSFNLYIDDNSVTKDSYTLKPIPGDGNYSITVNNYDLLPSTGFSIKASYTTSYLETSPTYLLSSYSGYDTVTSISLAEDKNSFTISLRGNMGFSMTEVPSNVLQIYITNIVKNASNIVYELETTLGGHPKRFYCDTYGPNSRYINIPESAVTKMSESKDLAEAEFLVDMTSFSAQDKQDTIFTINNLNTSITYTELVPTAVYDEGVTLEQAIPKVVTYSMNTSVKSNLRVYRFITNTTLSGKNTGYNDIFYTPKDLVSVDLSTFELKVKDTPTSTAVIYSLGLDYLVDPIPSGQAKITIVDKTKIPIDTAIVTASFKYQLPGKEEVVNCVLKGDIDGENNIFDIGPRLVGKRFTLEASSKVDPLVTFQPWRIHLDSSYYINFLINTLRPIGSRNDLESDPPEQITEYGRLVVGTKYQLLDDGTVYDIFVPENAPFQDYFICIYDTSYEDFKSIVYTQQTGAPSVEDRGGLYYNQMEYSSAFPNGRLRFDIDGIERKMTVGNISPLISEVDLNPSRPVSYVVSISDHGFAFHLKTEAYPEGRQGSFVCVQRPVNAKTGKVSTDGLTPVIGLFSQIDRIYQSTAGGSPYTKFPSSGLKTVWQIVVREKDVWTPSVPKNITYNQNNNDLNQSYSSTFWNAKKQISIAEDNSYIITVPDGIVTDRHLYHNERLDMIAFISANVIAESMVAKVNMHGELDSNGQKLMREYTAQRSTVGYHEGSRVMILTKGGGV
jgi:hypothetical protein